jgi:hypothetical protein
MIEGPMIPEMPPFHAVELDLEQGRYPDLNQVLDYWREKRGAYFAPRRTDIDPVDLRVSLSRITLSDVFEDPLDFRYRLCGTQICTTHVKNPTGLRALDMLPPAYGQLLHAHYCEAVRRRVPLLHLILLDDEFQSHSYARLLLPLSEDRQKVTMLMTIDSREQDTEDLREFFAKAILRGH